MSHATVSPRPHLWLTLARWGAVAVVIGIIAAATVLRERWLPLVSPASTAEEEHHDEDAHAHDDPNSLMLSPQARKNIGLRMTGEPGAPPNVALTSFTRTISLPGIVVERPGRSTVQVTTPMTGIVTKIHPLEGQAVEPGQLLFELRLTHEEIVQAQADLLRTAEELDVVSREIARLERVTVDGAIAGKTLLERKYEQQKLEAASRAQQQALELHGLSPEQVATIVKERSLLKNVQIVAPEAEMGEHGAFQVQSLQVAPGQHVEAGATLATLADYAHLFVEGSAFEADAALIQQAAKANAGVTALWDSGGQRRDMLDNLRLLYVSAKIEADTRALHFYVALPNEVAHEETLEEERKFVTWRFRPGQRMQLLVPVETWTERIVLPIDAIATDGAEAYVFTPSGDKFERRPVHLEYRDARHAVIANDGALFPGEQVVLAGAQQLQLALKAKAAGPVDPHAGHSH